MRRTAIDYPIAGEALSSTDPGATARGLIVDSFPVALKFHGCQHLQRGRHDTVRDALSKRLHVRSDGVRSQRSDVFPPLKNCNDISAQRRLTSETALYIDGRTVIETAMFSTDLCRNRAEFTNYTLKHIRPNLNGRNDVYQDSPPNPSATTGRNRPIDTPIFGPLSRILGAYKSTGCSACPYCQLGLTVWASQLGSSVRR